MMRYMLAICALCASNIALAQEKPYLLNPGDVLEISVWKEEGMQRSVLVLPDGKISYPLAGQFQAAGRTPEDIQKFLVKRLDRFFPDPVITVSVVNVNGNKIFVLGQVRQPGEFLITRPVDVVQALSLAGGLTQFADEDEIKILRRDAAGKQVAMPFDFSEVQKGEGLETNILLKAGDVVVVPTKGLF